MGYLGLSICYLEDMVAQGWLVGWLLITHIAGALEKVRLDADGLKINIVFTL